jgi:hypothetical protein
MREAIKDAYTVNPGLKVAAILNCARRTTMSEDFRAMLQEWTAPTDGRAVLGYVPQHVAFAQRYGAGKAPRGASIDLVLARLLTFVEL